MSLHCQLLTSESYNAYSDYVYSHANSTFEHTLLWKELMEKNYGFESKYLLCKDDADRIKGVLPLFKAKSIFGTRLVSIPFSIHCGILADNTDAADALVNYCLTIFAKEKCSYLELRDAQEYKSPQEFSLVKKVFEFTLQLSSDYSQVWKKLPKGSVRWGIKKAEKSGITWQCGNSQQELDDFYQMFMLTRKFRGVPGYPYRYFQDIISSFDKNVKIYNAYLHGKTVASIFLIYYKTEVRYAFAGALHKQKYIQLQPYHLLLWEAIKDACAKGYTTFNFGGSYADTNDGGLYEFKKKWSDKIEPLPYYFYPALKDPSTQGNGTFFRIAGMVWKRLPLRLIKLLSPIVIKQFV